MSAQLGGFVRNSLGQANPDGKSAQCMEWEHVMGYREQHKIEESVRSRQRRDEGLCTARVEEGKKER